MEQKILEMLENLTTTVGGLTTAVQELSTRMEKVEKKQDDMQTDIKAMQTDIHQLQGDTKAIRAGQEEQSVLLGGLDEFTRISKDTHDNQVYDIAELAGRVTVVEDAMREAGKALSIA